MGHRASHGRGAACLECGTRYSVADDVASVQEMDAEFRANTKTLADFVLNKEALGLMSLVSIFAAKCAVALAIMRRISSWEGHLIYSSTERLVREGRCVGCAFKTAVIDF